LVLAGLWLCAPPPDAGSGMTSLARLEPVNEAQLPEVRTSILVCHRFGPVVADSMTIRTRTFRWQLEYLKAHGYSVIPLREWIAWRLRLGPPPPARSVIITADDGHRTVFTDMLPLVRELGTEKRRLPPATYRAGVLTQLTRSKTVLEQRLGVNVDMIAWSFGVYDDELLQVGVDAGYLAGVTLDRRVATSSGPLMGLSRFLITDAASGRHFAAVLPSESP